MARRGLSVRSDERRRHAQLYPLLGMGSQRGVSCCCWHALRSPGDYGRAPSTSPPTPHSFQPTDTLPTAAARCTKNIQKVIAARRDCHSGSRDCHVPPRGSPPIPNRIAPSVGCRCSTSKVPATKKEFYSSSHASFLPHSIPRRRHTQWPLKGWTKRASSGVSSRRDVSPS